MGLFSKKTKANPVIETQGFRIEYHLDGDCWQFNYKGADFIAYGSTFVVPCQELLRSILADVEKLQPEMARKLVEGWKEWETVKTNDGETYVVNLTDFHSEGSFQVSWSGGQSWGDMEIDFTKNHEIVDESWGD